MAESDEEEIFERAYQAELEKIRIQEIERRVKKPTARATPAKSRQLEGTCTKA